MKKSVIIASVILLLSGMFVVSCSQPQQTPANNTPSNNTPTVSIVGTWYLEEDASAPDTLIFYDSGIVDIIEEGESERFNYIITSEGNFSITIYGDKYTGTFGKTSLTLRLSGESVIYTRG